MSLAKKTTSWVKEGFITQEQQQNILSFERKHSNHFFWNAAFIIAGSLIGLGICLLIAANWKVLPNAVKLVGDFILLGGFFYAAYWSIQNKRSGLRELFLILSFVGIAATIGLIGQIFQLSGGWQKFAWGWVLLSSPFVFVSRNKWLGMVWFGSLVSALPEVWLETISDWTWHFSLNSVLFYALVYIFHLLALKWDERIHQHCIMAEAIALFLIWSTYFYIFFTAVDWTLHHHNFWAYLLVFGFFAMRMYTAMRQQNLVSFKRNAILTEIYIFLIFACRMHNLWLSGLGFIGGGLLILLLIWALRKTTHYIKQMDTFK